MAEHEWTAWMFLLLWIIFNIRCVIWFNKLDDKMLNPDKYSDVNNLNFTDISRQSSAQMGQCETNETKESES